MAVSKRVRYEVLRRDGFACRYCGAAAPTAVLEVDHVVPVALGGSDDPSNLVAACADCNSGKSSAAPDSELVTDVQADAARWSEAMQRAAEESRTRRAEREDVLNEVADAWPSFRRLPGGWESSIERFLDAGLPGDLLVELVHVANDTPGIGNRWGYFCGCCWKRIRALQERAQQIVKEAEVE